LRGPADLRGTGSPVQLGFDHDAEPVGDEELALEAQPDEVEVFGIEALGHWLAVRLLPCRC